MHAPLLELEDTPLDGLKVVRPKTHSDARGSFFEAWHRPRFEMMGLSAQFVQDNVVMSRKGVLRGLHFQHPRAQLKLVTALYGEVYDVVVDIRKKSPSFGKWFALCLSAENHNQLWIEPGFAHGYQVLSDTAVISYKCTHIYETTDDRTIFWADPEIAIEWPLPNPILSPKDAIARPLANFADTEIF